MRLLSAVILGVLTVWGGVMVLTAHEPEPPGKTVLTWATDDTPIRREQVRAFNEMNPDLELRIDPTNRDGNKVVVQSLGGVGPDLFDIAGNALPVFVNAGIAMDVTDELAERGIDAAAEVWPAADPLFRYEGRVYGIPANLDTIAVLWNEAIFEEAGVEPLSANPTWDEIIEKGKQLTVRDAEGRIERYGLLFWWDWRDFFAFEGARIFSEDGVQLMIDSPEALAALRRMHSFVYEHKIAPTPTELNAMATAGGWGGGNESRFVAGKAAMVLGPRYFTAHFRRAGNMRVGVSPVPLAPQGVTRARGRTVAVNVRSPRREMALRFLEYLAGPVYNAINNDMADGMGPIERFTREPKFLFNPEFPQERSNEAWRESLLSARPEQTSPFLSNAKVDEAVQFHLDLVSQGKKTPEQALKDIQSTAERLMRESLRENPALARRHAELGGGAE